MGVGNHEPVAKNTTGASDQREPCVPSTPNAEDTAQLAQENKRLESLLREKEAEIARLRELVSLEQVQDEPSCRRLSTGDGVDEPHETGHRNAGLQRKSSASSLETEATVGSPYPLGFPGGMKNLLDESCGAGCGGHIPPAMMPGSPRLAVEARQFAAVFYRQAECVAAGKKPAGADELWKTDTPLHCSSEGHSTESLPPQASQAGPPSPSLDEDLFTKTCDSMGFGLSASEAARLFARLEPNSAGLVSIRRLRKAIPESLFLRAMIARFLRKSSWTVPKDYNYNVTTEAAHCHKIYRANGTVPGRGQIGDLLMSDRLAYCADLHGPLVGDYHDIREGLDFSYHVNYTEQRQRWQDMAITAMAVRHIPVPCPWIIFTAGAMGSGKGYVMRWLSGHNMLPLEAVAKLDPDEFKAQLPEWPGYVKRDREDKLEEAGSMCHKESGMLVEIAQEVALAHSQNIWVDGSLQDHEWYTKVFADIRRRFPHYRLAVFYVHCSEDKVYVRAGRRALTTGRSVPRAVLEQSIRRTRESISILAPLADVLCVFRSEGTVPELERFEDRTGSMRAIIDRFSSHPEPPKFPRALRPMVLQEVVWTCAGEPPSALKLSPAVCEAIGNDTATKNHYFPIRDAFIEYEKHLKGRLDAYGCRGDDYVMVFSAGTQDHYDHLSSKVAGIPSNVEKFSWCYGAARADGKRLSQLQAASYGLDLNDPVVMLMVSGGFVYVGRPDGPDGAQAVLCINTFMPTVESPANPQRSPSQQSRAAAASLPVGSRAIHFEAPSKVPGPFARALITAGRMMPTTKREILAAGADTYAFVLPHELPACAPFGGFVYAYNEREMMLFPCAPAH